MHSVNVQSIDGVATNDPVHSSQSNLEVRCRTPHQHAIVNEQEVRRWREQVLKMFENRSRSGATCRSGSILHGILAKMHERGVGKPDWFEDGLCIGVNPDLEADDGTTTAQLCQQWSMPRCMQVLEECRASHFSTQPAASTADSTGRTVAGFHRAQPITSEWRPLGLAYLAMRERFHSVQNLIRRGLFSLDREEFYVKENRRTAEEWAEFHDRLNIAAEIKFWATRAETLHLDISPGDVIRKADFGSKAEPSLDTFCVKNLEWKEETEKMLEPILDYPITSLEWCNTFYRTITEPCDFQVPEEKRGFNAAHLPVQSVRNDEVGYLGTILTTGVNPDKPDNNDSSRPAHFCAVYGWSRCLQLLIECRIDLNAVKSSSSSQTPLELARQLRQRASGMGSVTLDDDFSRMLALTYSSAEEKQAHLARLDKVIEILECHQKSRAERGYETLAQLAFRGRFAAILNVLRRPGFVEAKEYLERENELTAQQWAIEHGRVDIAAEIEFWMAHSQEVLQDRVVAFILFCRRAAGADFPAEEAQDMSSNQNPVSWIKKSLFAPSKSSQHQLPLIAHLAEQYDMNVYVGCPYHEIERMLGLHPENPAAMEQAFLEYIGENPGVVSTMTLLYSFRSDVRVILRLLKEVGRFLNHAALNKWGESALMVIVQWRIDSHIFDQAVNVAHANCDPKTFEELVMDVAENARGHTLAHYCALHNAGDYLDILLDYYGPERLNKKRDLAGFLPHELGELHGYQDIAARLLGTPNWKTKGVAKKETQDNSFGPHGRQLLLPGIPAIYTPSDAKNLQVNRTGSVVHGGTSAPDQTSLSDEVIRYMKMEFPGLLGDRDPSLIVVPPTFPENCPFVHPEQLKGWNAEKEVFQRLQEQLLRFQQENPHLRVALFHSLRYLSEPNGGSVGRKEHEIDLVVLSYDLNAGNYSAVFFEIKAGANAKNTLKKDSWKAVLQPAQHLAALRKQLDASLGAVKLCVALPWALGDDCSRITEVIEQGVDNLLSKELPHETEDVLKNIKSGSYQFVALSAEVLKEDDKLMKWLTDHLKPGPDTGPASELFKLLAWCLTRCMGAEISQTSQQMDNLILLDDAEQASCLTTPQHVALLTTKQITLVNMPIQDLPGRVHLIMGSPGTGKSLVAQQKLLSMLEEGWISTERQALYISSSSNAAFNAQTMNGFKRYDNISVLEWDEVCGMSIKECVQAIQSKLGIMEKVSYVVFEQVEDIDKQEAIHCLGELLKSCCSDKPPLQMLWLLLDPISQRRCRKPSLRSLIDFASSLGLCSFLDGIIRNTQAISTKFLQEISGGIIGSLHRDERLAPIPLGHAGRKLLSGFPLPDHISSCSLFSSGKPEEEQAAAAAAALIKLKCNWGVNFESVTVIYGTGANSTESFLFALDENLVQQFSKTKNKLHTMAPVMVPSVLFDPRSFVFTADERKDALAHFESLKDISDGFENWSKLRSVLKNCVCIHGEREKKCKTPLLGIVEGIVRRCATLNLEDDQGIEDDCMVTELDDDGSEICQTGQVQQAANTATNGSTAGEKKGEMLLRQLEELLRAQDKTTAGGKKQVTRLALAELLERFDYVSVLDINLVSGYEADVIIYVSQQDDIHLALALSRGKVMAVVIPRHGQESQLKALFGEMEDIFEEERRFRWNVPGVPGGVK